MDGIVGLMLVMFAYLCGVDVREVSIPEYEQIARGYGVPESSQAVTHCEDGGGCVIYIAHGRSPWPTTTLAHEVLHVVDWSDDRKFNGSLLPYPPTSDDPAHEYVYWALRNPDTAARAIERMGR